MGKFTFLLSLFFFVALVANAGVLQEGGARSAQAKPYAVEDVEQGLDGLKPRERNRPFNNIGWDNLIGIISTIGALLCFSFAGNLFMTGQELFPDVAGTSEQYIVSSIVYGVLGSLFLLSALNNFLDWGIPLADLIYCLI